MQLVVDSMRAVVQHYPGWLRAEMEEALPSMALEASRLALEVMQAERDGIPYVDAARRIDFPLMGRVHFGLEDLLQQRVPDFVRQAVRSLAAATKRGEFDELRRCLFAGAARRDTPEAALLRFLLYEGARIDLLAATWHIPELEVLGALARIDAEAQTILEARLSMPQMFEGDVRPLHVLVVDLALRAFGDAESVALALQERDDAVELVLRLVEATRTIRGLDAPNAAVARAEAFDEEVGAEQLCDRYPWHFASPNTVDQRRSRLRRAIAGGAPPLVTDGSRYIDVIREEEEGA